MEASGSAQYPIGERVEVDLRLIVAPKAGVFSLPAGDDWSGASVLVTEGQTVGCVSSLDESTPILSRFSGTVVFKAEQGQRVRRGQTIAWLRVEDSVTRPKV